MNKVIKYQTITDPLPSNLRKKVEALLEKGWELHGDQNVITQGSHHSHPEYSQVMVKWERSHVAYYVGRENE